MSASRFTPAEHAAIQAAKQAAAAVATAIRLYRAAGFGDHVTSPLVDARVQIAHSVREVTS